MIQDFAALMMARIDCARLTDHSRVAGTSFCRCGAICYGDALEDNSSCGFSRGYGRRCVKRVNHSGAHRFQLVKP